MRTDTHANREKDKTVTAYLDGRKYSFVHSADLCRAGVRVRVRGRSRVRAVIDRYAM